MHGLSECCGQTIFVAAVFRVQPLKGIWIQRTGGIAKAMPWYESELELVRRTNTLTWRSLPESCRSV